MDSTRFSTRYGSAGASRPRAQHTARVLVAVPASVVALLSPSGVNAQQKIDMRREASPDISVRIQGAFASLHIVGWDKDSVVIAGVVPKGFRVEGGFGGAAGSPSRGGKVFIEGPDPLGPSGGAIEMRVPSKARVWAKASTAHIDVAGVSGGLDLNIVGGSVQVAGSPSELSIESMDGNITVTGSPGWARLKTAAGEIVMRGGSSDAAFTSVSGAIRVSGGALERARFESVTGAIDFAGDVARGGAFTFDTHSGAIDVRLDRKVSCEIDAASIAGTIENQITVRRATPGRDGRGATFVTSLGQGDARMTIRTYKGHIRLSSR